MRIFAISDLHVDFPANQRLVESLSERDYVDDVLIVAGDVADDLSQLAACLTTLRQRFARLFYLPGNHELWVRREEYDSWEKLHRLLAICAGSGVETAAADCGAVRIVPLQSWYEADFVPGAAADLNLLAMWSDFRRCRWGDDASALAERMSARNVVPPPAAGQLVISFSHFLPRPELLPPIEHLLYKALGAVSGSHRIEAQLRQAGSSVHVYGHTHINREHALGGVRYVQNALGYPRERRTELTQLPIKQLA